MTDAVSPLAIKFRCPPELSSLLPRPIPALLGLPEWFKTMPQSTFSGALQTDQFTVKKCPPFIDAMTYGFLIPLATDLRVENGAFSWHWDAPSNKIANYTHSPLDFHDSNQVEGTPFFDPDRFVIKFNNWWTVELPPGYSLLVTHPVNRYDLPFTTLTGMVDADRYCDNFINFPAHWRDLDFNGVLPKGTPIAQCIPLKRDIWAASFGDINGDAVRKLQETSTAVTTERGVYRRQFRAAKR